MDTARGRRATATGILYLLDAGERSAWHRVASDELWLHHAGGALVLRSGGTGDRPGEAVEVLLGGDVLAGERPQALVPAGCWQSAQPATGAAVLVSCVVSPGFDYEDFELLAD